MLMSMCQLKSEVSFMNIQSSHEVERCPEGSEVEWCKVFMIRAQEFGGGGALIIKEVIVL